MDLYKNKTIIVTGAGAGIGRATALAFAIEGADVVVSDIDEKRGVETARLIHSQDGSCTFIGCDVSNEADVKNLVKTTLDRYGKLHGAFNNAGTEGEVAQTTECSLENWNKVIDTDLKGVWLCMKYEIPAMIEAGGGTIVNCSSIAGLVGIEAIPAYVASKHGVIGLTQAAALEYAKKNIRVNAVCPGPIHTKMLDRFTGGNEEPMAKATPMGRVGRADEVADTVLWLMSSKSSYVTGQSLAIDGGWVSQ